MIAPETIEEIQTKLAEIAEILAANNFGVDHSEVTTKLQRNMGIGSHGELLDFGICPQVVLINIKATEYIE